ncbi:MAG: hypothetical protein K5829_08670 [Treponema sp.]|nr:hypothetical protein [Treponema sp.]
MNYMQLVEVGNKMNRHNLSKRYQAYYRVIGVIGLLLLLASLLLNITIILKGEQKDAPNNYIVVVTIRLFLNIISEVFFIIIIIKPERCEFFAHISLIYTYFILITDKINLIAVFMAILGITVLKMRGFFIAKKQLKISILVFLYTASLCTEIRFGKAIFLEAVLHNLAAFFISGITFLFIQKYLTSITNRYEPRILDLTKYKELNEQDKEIIKFLKEGQKYDWIAGSQGIATSTLKKHVKRIFEILDVTDLVDFHAEFGGREIIYKKEELIEWKKKFLEENHSND